MRDKRDAVDRIVSEWHTVRPDLDVSPIEVLGRVSRLSRILDRRLTEQFGRHDIESWMYDVLAALRRVGAPYELSAGDLVARTMVTTGAMTNRIDRLEQRRLVERAPSPVDRRSVIVRLTQRGLELVDAVADDHYAFEQDLLASLSSTARTDLVRSLRGVLVALGDVDR